MTEAEIGSILKRQQAFFRSGRTLDVDWRIRQLKRLKESLLFYETEIERAMKEDLMRSPVEAYLCDIGPVLMELQEAIRGLKRWAKPELRYSGLHCFPSSVTRVYKMPYGSCLILSPFNFPFVLSLGVLIPAIAGGNTAVIKASSKSKACTELLSRIIGRAFPEKYVTVLGGGHEEADLCLAADFDKIFYTGSPRVGRHVLAMASKNLTPAALELGGETGNWCVVRADADLQDAARKIAFAKLLNAGQICIDINQVAVARERAEEFLYLLQKAYIRQIGKDPLKNPDYPRLIQGPAYEACRRDAEKYRDRIVYGGKGDPSTGRFEPTLIYPVDIHEEIVQRELFNPLLPIVPYEDQDIDQLIRTIESRQRGLAFYVFTRDMDWARKVTGSMQFGGGCINEVIMHLTVKGAPFNGSGHSGMGAYHGEWGFREFTRPKTVLEGSNKGNLPLREHPYSGGPGAIKLQILKLMER